MQILSAGHINYWSLERSVGLGVQSTAHARTLSACVNRAWALVSVVQLRWFLRRIAFALEKIRGSWFTLSKGNLELHGIIYYRYIALGRTLATTMSSQ